jgi:hypothetical protein
MVAQSFKSQGEASAQYEMGTGFVGGIGTLRYEVIKVIEGLGNPENCAISRPDDIYHIAIHIHISINI